MACILLVDKGTIGTHDSLPLVGNLFGDFYLIADTGLSYYWSSLSASGFIDDWKIVNRVDPEFDFSNILCWAARR